MAYLSVCVLFFYSMLCVILFSTKFQFTNQDSVI